MCLSKAKGMMKNMTESRRLVYQTLENKKPERAPRHVWDIQWTYEQFPQEIQRLKEDYPDDIVWCPRFLKSDSGCKGDPYAIGTYVDEWGCVFDNKFEGIIGEVKHAQITSDEWEETEQIAVPKAFLDLDADAINEYCKNTEQFVLAGSSVRIFERIQFLAGTEKTLMDLFMDPDSMQPAIQKVHQFFCEELKAWAQTDVDALFIQDDWGTQISLLISPELWRVIFKPLYREYAEIARKYDKKIFMHSDGYILDIIPDLIEIGIDALNSQIFCMGLDKLEQFRGKITFWGEIDRQQVLPFGSLEDVENAVKSVKKKLWKDGGCIAQCDFGVGVNPQNVFKVFETWEKIV
ncbi:putative methyltransferase CmuC [Clostridium sp. D5]|nr:putative methyltransferase CmuC [Clostridium sp. D5]